MVRTFHAAGQPHQVGIHGRVKAEEGDDGVTSFQSGCQAWVVIKPQVMLEPHLYSMKAWCMILKIIVSKFTSWT